MNYTIIKTTNYGLFVWTIEDEYVVYIYNRGEKEND